MLRDGVIQAVNQKKFHIYPVAKIEEGIELLTGRTAGKLDTKGKYEKGSIFFLVEKRLKEMGGAEKETGGRRKRRKR